MTAMKTEVETSLRRGMGPVLGERTDVRMMDVLLLAEVTDQWHPMVS